jgi:hypothetical protein
MVQPEAFLPVKANAALRLESTLRVPEGSI